MFRLVFFEGLAAVGKTSMLKAYSKKYADAHTTFISYLDLHEYTQSLGLTPYQLKTTNRSELIKNYMDWYLEKFTLIVSEMYRCYRKNMLLSSNTDYIWLVDRAIFLAQSIYSSESEDVFPDAWKKLDKIVPGFVDVTVTMFNVDNVKLAANILVPRMVKRANGIDEYTSNYIQFQHTRYRSAMQSYVALKERNELRLVAEHISLPNNYILDIEEVAHIARNDVDT